MFLLPVFVVGYSIWDKKKKEEEEELSKKNGPQSPESVEGPVFEGAADSLTRQNTEDSDSSSDSNSSKGEEGVAGDKTFTPPREKEGPFRAIRKFFAEAQGNNEAFQIKTNEDKLTFEVMGNQGDLALNFPQISFK
jgi:hypothetical protein